jgi:DNA invertase Pin-like site-specific DNA recombinase
VQSPASIADQRRGCQARANREGWQAVNAFTDRAKTGSTTRRPGYQALFEMIRAGGIDVVLTASLDRLSRGLEHIASFNNECEFHEARIHTVAVGDIWLSRRL